MSSKSQKKSKSKKNEQQKDEPIDGVDEQDVVYHEGDEDYVTKKKYVLRHDESARVDVS